MNKITRRLLTFFIGVPLVLFIVCFTPLNHILLHLCIVVFAGISSSEIYNLMKKNMPMQSKGLVVGLGNDANVAAKAFKRDVLRINAVNGYPTVRNVVEPGDKVTERTLSSARGSDKSKHLARFNTKIKRRNNVLHTVGVTVAEGNVVEDKVALDVGYLDLALVNLVRLGEDVAESRKSAHALLKLLEERNKAVDGVDKTGNEEHKCGKFARIDLSHNKEDSSD